MNIRCFARTVELFKPMSGLVNLVPGGESSSSTNLSLQRIFGTVERSNMAKTILIVEDNELNMKLFHDLLEAHNYNTLQTRDGNDALALAREHKPDLILMDIQLPGVSGLEVTRQIKADDDLKSIPVVAVTAFAMKGDEDRIREGGCEAYIAKPIRIDELISTVQQFIGSE
jgi:two-component system, cell cycle response regulator DivK